jgi:two-component system response regulator FlrC
VTAFGSLDTAKEAMRLGAFDYLNKPFDHNELVGAVQKSLKSEDRFRPQDASDAPVILTQDQALAETLALARRAADSRATILIQAESGTGKELFANLIHAASPRRKGPFVAINCAAIPENLLESELFGFEKGAFTGATSSKAGRFEQADGGTLVLDEIGELPLALQGKLLRAIQERVIDRLGGSKSISIDARIIALTNRDLAQEVREGHFREDLFYRLNVIPLRLPPLRERKGDLRLLAAHFAELYSRENGRPTPDLSPGFFAALDLHPWPGNIRELENAMQRCIVLCGGATLGAADLEWLLGSEAIASLPADEPGARGAAQAQSHAPEGTARSGAAPAAQNARARDDRPHADKGTDQEQGRGDQPVPYARAAPQMADPAKPLTGVPLGTPVTLPLGLPLPDLERFWLLSTLAAVEGNRTHCAQRLNIALRTVRNKINEYREQGYGVPGGRPGRDDDGG